MMEQQGGIAAVEKTGRKQMPQQSGFTFELNPAARFVLRNLMHLRLFDILEKFVARAPPLEIGAHRINHQPEVGFTAPRWSRGCIGRKLREILLPLLDFERA